MKARSTIKFPDQLHRVLYAHYKSLVEAHSSKELLDDYLRLLRIVRGERAAGNVDQRSTELPFHGPGPDATRVNVSSLLTVSLDELETIVQSEGTSRRLLEGIAVQRFSVPKGSLRQYSNRQLLVEKLENLIRNERTHNTIGEIARLHEA